MTTDKQSPPTQRFNLNRSMKIGNVVKDPVQRTLPDGRRVTNFPLAVNTWFFDASGQRRENKVQYYNIVVYNRFIGDRVIHTIKKGKPVFVEGPDRLRHWTKVNGEKTATVDIIALNVFPMTVAGADYYEWEITDYPEPTDVDAWELNRGDFE